MASTWSALKIELLETGANSGTWGTATNVNLGDAILGEAITGQATVDFATDADVTITLTDSATSQAARNLRLNITESSTGVGSVRNLILGSGCQIEKFYLINNTGTGAKTVKNTSGTGISVPAGKATLVFNNGTNVVDAASYFTSLTLGSALPVASGGTGITSFGSGVATFLGTPSSANLAAALTDETGSGSAVFATSPTLVTPNLGTPSTLVLTSATALPLSSGVTGTLPIANGGTGTTSTTFASLTTNVTGTLPVANGGTNLTSFTANGVVYASSGSVLATGSGLLFDGTNLGVGLTPTGQSRVHVYTGNNAVNGVQTQFNASNFPIALGSSTSSGFPYVGVNTVQKTNSDTQTYAINGFASRISASGGGFQFGIAPSGTAGADITFTNAMNLDTAGYLSGVWADEVYALGNTGTSIGINCTTGNVFTATLTGNCTFTLSGASTTTANTATSFTLILTNDATAGRTVAWAGGTFKFPGGSVTRTTTANAIDIWFFFSPNGGTTWYGSIPMANLS